MKWETWTGYTLESYDAKICGSDLIDTFKITLVAWCGRIEDEVAIRTILDHDSLPNLW